MLQARLRKTFPKGPDSAGFSLDVDIETGAGVTVLFGPSGAGKTLVLDSIAGFTRPDDGRILLDDSLLFDGAAGVHLTPQARNCGYVIQNHALFPHMSVRKNLMFAAERRPRLERHRRVNDMLETFRLADVAGLRPHQISGGQRQRCSIARALIGAPRLLLLDEPTQGLDSPLKMEFYEILRTVQTDFKTPMILVTHDLDECFELGEEMLILREGRVVQAGPPRKVLDQPSNLDVARLLGLYNLIPCEIRALDPGRNTSKIQLGAFELDGPYFPGRLKGDRVTLSVRPESLLVSPRLGRPGPNQIPATLIRAIEKTHGMRLEFEGGIAAEMRPSEYEKLRDNKEWLIEFPASSLRVL